MSKYDTTRESVTVIHVLVGKGKLVNEEVDVILEMDDSNQSPYYCWKVFNSFEGIYYCANPSVEYLKKFIEQGWTSQMCKKMPVYLEIDYSSIDIVTVEIKVVTSCTVLER